MLAPFSMGARFLRESDLGARKQGSVVDSPPQQEDPTKMTESSEPVLTTKKVSKLWKTSSQPQLQLSDHTGCLNEKSNSVGQFERLLRGLSCHKSIMLNDMKYKMVLLTTTQCVVDNTHKVPKKLQF